MRTKIAIATVALALTAAANAQATSKNDVLIYHGIRCIATSDYGIYAIVCWRPNHPNAARIGITSTGQIAVTSGGKAVYVH
jgi:hypothetical protein